MSAPALQGSFATSHTVQNVRPPPPAPASPASESESHRAFPSSPNTRKPRGTVTSATGESGSAAENFIWYRPAGTGSIYEATSPTGVADGVGAFGEPPLPAGLDAAQPAVRTINARAAATEILLGQCGEIFMATPCPRCRRRRLGRGGGRSAGKEPAMARTLSPTAPRRPEA